MMSQNTILRDLGIESADEGTPIYIYRVYRNEFMSQKCITSEKGLRHRGIAGFFDDEGVLVGELRISNYEGELFSRSGVNTVWFTKASMRKAKKILRDHYKENLKEYETRVKTCKDILEVLK